MRVRGPPSPGGTCSASVNQTHSEHCLPPCCSLLSFQPGEKQDSVMIRNSYQMLDQRQVILMCCSQCWISYTNCDLVYVHVHACICIMWLHIDMCSHTAYTHVCRCVLLCMYNLWMSVGVSVHMYCVHMLCTYMHVYMCMSLKKLLGHTHWISTSPAR